MNITNKNNVDYLENILSDLLGTDHRHNTYFKFDRDKEKIIFGINNSLEIVTLNLPDIHKVCVECNKLGPSDILRYIVSALILENGRRCYTNGRQSKLIEIQKALEL